MTELYSASGLNLITSLTPQIMTAAEYYGVSPLAVAGAISQEQLNQSNNPAKADLSTLDGDAYLTAISLPGLAYGLKMDPGNAGSIAEQAASDLILSEYNNTDNIITVGSDSWNKILNPIFVDYGDAGIKFANAIGDVLAEPDAPGLAPYVNNYWNLGVNLITNSDPQLTATAVAAYVQQGQQFIASAMGGSDAWNSLSPTFQNALSVQYFNQGPGPVTNAYLAADNGLTYQPGIGIDGAGANYVANEGVLAIALISPSYWVDQSKISSQASDQVFPGYTPDAVPGANPFNPNGTLEQATGASSYDPGAPSTVPYTPVAVTTADFASAQTVTPTGTETVGGYSYVAVDPAAPALASATSAAQDAPRIT